MNPRRALARLAPGIVHYGDQRGGGQGDLTPAEVCFALAQVSSRAGQLLLLWAWAGQQEVRPELERLLLERVVALAVEQRWRNKGCPGLLRRLVGLALDESVGGKRCGECGGGGELYQGAVVWACGGCGGRGVVPISERARARRAEVCWRTWQRSWSNRYRRVATMVDQLEASSLAAVRGALA